MLICDFLPHLKKTLKQKAMLSIAFVFSIGY